MVLTNPIRILVAVLIVGLPWLDGGTTHIPMTIYRVGFLVAALAVMWQAMTTGSITIPKSPILLPLLAISIISAIWFIASPYIYMSLQWVMTMSAFAVLLVMCLLPWQDESARLRNEHINMWVGALLLTAVIQSVWGIATYFIDDLQRAKGTFFNPTYFGSFLAMTSGWAIARLFSALQDRQDPQRKGRAILWASVSGLLLTGAVLSKSRAAILVFGIVCLITSWHYIRWRAPVLVAAVLAMLILLPTPLHKRVFQSLGGDIYAWERTNIWSSTTSMIVEHPLGVGPGIYKYYSPRYAFPVEKAFARYGKVAKMSHSMYLQSAAELSPLVPLLGLLAAIWCLWAGSFGRNGTTRNEQGPDKTRPPPNQEPSIELIGSLAALSGFLVHGLFDSVLHSAPLATTGIVAAGTIARQYWQSNGKPIMSIKCAARLRWALIPITTLLAYIAIAQGAAFYVANAGKRAAIEGDSERASQLYANAMVLSPQNASYPFSLSAMKFRAFQHSGKDEDFHNSIELIEQAMAYNPLEPQYPMQLADCYIAYARASKNQDDARRAYLKATEYYGRALTLNPYDPFLFNKMGVAYIYLQNPNAAIENFSNAIKLEPNYFGVRVNLIDMLIVVGNLDQARQHYTILMKLWKKRPRKIIGDYPRLLAALKPELIETVRIRLERAEKRAL